MTVTFKVYIRVLWNMFLARDVIYTSRAYLMMPVSVCDVHCGHRVQWISLHAWIDGCLYYLLTTPDQDCRMG